MKVSRKNLADAVAQGILSRQQAEALIEFLRSDPGQSPGFDFTHVLYYLGGLIAIGAMTLFMTLGWEAFGGAGILGISCLYALIGLKLTNTFRDRGYLVPAGISASFVVALAPLAIYGFQQALGLWPDNSSYREYHQFIKWHWLYMELATLAVGAFMLWKYRFPFLVMPVAVTLWYLTMDVSAMISGGDFDWALRKLVSMYGGLLMILLAVWVDIRSRYGADHAFWLYLFGVIAFWSGLSLQYSESELAKFAYFCINLLMIGAGVLLVRRVFVVFGALGICGYLGHLAYEVFENSWLFPIVLTVIGLAIVYLGILWQKHEQHITNKTRRLLPARLKETLASRSN